MCPSGLAGCFLSEGFHLHRHMRQARFFRSKSHQVALKRITRGGERGSLSMHGKHKAAHQPGIPAAMSANLLHLGREGLAFHAPIQMIMDLKPPLTVGELAQKRRPRSINPQRAPLIMGVPMHGEGDSDAALKGHVDGLMIDHVVIAMINAATIRSMSQRFHDGMIAFGFFGDRVAGPTAVFGQDPDGRDDLPKGERQFGMPQGQLTDRSDQRILGMAHG